MSSRILKAKAYDLWKMPFPTGPTGLSFSDSKIKTPSSESALRRPFFGPDNGVHLSQVAAPDHLILWQHPSKSFFK
jgi:hypothetical protein